MSTSVPPSLPVPSNRYGSSWKTQVGFGHDETLGWIRNAVSFYLCSSANMVSTSSSFDFLFKTKRQLGLVLSFLFRAKQEAFIHFRFRLVVGTIASKTGSSSISLAL